MRKALPIFLPFLALLSVVSYAQEYTGNPVFGQGVGGPKAYYPSVLYNAEKFSGHGSSSYYKMWYGSDGGTGLATSDDGINWTDLGIVKSNHNANHAAVEYYPDGFAGLNSGENPSGATMYYRMWYWPGLSYSINDIRYSDSPDGINWYNDQPLQNGTVPIVGGGETCKGGTLPWNRGSYGPCDILYNPSASNSGTDWTFTMYYDGTTGGDEAIGVGFSSDGITWTGYDPDGNGKANAVLEGTYISGDWDRNYVSRATIIKLGPNNYQMWYSGGDGAMNHGIGYATSADGFNWTRNATNPIFHKTDTGYPGYPWRSDRTYCPAVIYESGVYKMWYAGKSPSGNYAIGYASGSSPLIPVELISFSAMVSNYQVTISWTTATETENLGFHLFRSTDPEQDYQKITPALIKGSGSSAQAHSYSFIDRNVQPSQTYYYKLADVDYSGNMRFHGPISVTVDAKPSGYSLSQNYPNPFNPETAINFSLKEAGKVTLKIYNLQGQLVRTLVDEEKLAGSYSVMWNGTADNGAKLASGIYYYTLKVNGFEASKKLALIK
ncbi:MAG: T9SS type A sorting domain-containing protein [candidate division KSB1 bacterium]|nr:T9SS type A sorting domain-containing protein [candidate division KSB1 bacterium]